MKNDKKKKKAKTVYIDDGRTIADMSGVGGFRSPKKEKTVINQKSKWETYKEAVRMMFLPMLVTMGIISLAFLIVYLLLVL